MKCLISICSMTMTFMYFMSFLCNFIAENHFPKNLKSKACGKISKVGSQTSGDGVDLSECSSVAIEASNDPVIVASKKYH